MKKFLIVLLVLCSTGCARYVYDERVPACRDKKTGQFVTIELCK